MTRKYSTKSRFKVFPLQAMKEMGRYDFSSYLNFAVDGDALST